MNPAYQDFVGPRFNAVANFPPNGVISCQVCASTTGSCDGHWSTATWRSSTGVCSGNSTCADGEQVTVGLRALQGSVYLYSTTITRRCDDTWPEIGTTRGVTTGGWTRTPFTLEADVSDGTGSGVALCEAALCAGGACADVFGPGLLENGVCRSATTDCTDGQPVQARLRVTDHVGNQAATGWVMAHCDQGPLVAGVLTTSSGNPDAVTATDRVSVQFQDGAGAGVVSCALCVSRDGTCDTEWTDATSDQGTCTSAPLDCQDGEQLLLAARGSDGLYPDAFAAPRTVHCDTRAPTAPAPLQVTLDDQGAVHLSWSASLDDGAGLAASPYQVRYGPTAQAPWDGTGAAEGPSPLPVQALTQATLTGLPRCTTVHVAVTARDAVGLESAPATAKVRLPCGATGTFADPVGFGITAASWLQGRRAEAADFNEDGVPDVLALGDADAQVLYLAGQGTRGHGTGLLAPGRLALPLGSGIGQPVDLAVGDFTGDGILDAVVLGYNGTTLLAGAGNGNFTASVLDASAHAGTDRVLAADFNGDGALDYALHGSTTLKVALGTLNTGRPTGLFDAPLSTSYPAGLTGSTTAAAVADMDGDRFPDVVVAGTSVGVFPGLGTGRFGTPVVLAAGLSASGTRRVKLADFTGDGHRDVLVALLDPGLALALFAGHSTGALTAAGTFSHPAYWGTQKPQSLALAVGDVNGDGWLDAVTLHTSSDGSASQATLWMATSTAQFQPQAGPTLNSAPAGDVVLADHDADGVLDLGMMVESGYYDSSVVYALSRGVGHLARATGDLAAAQSLAVAAGSLGMVTADLDLDGMPEVLLAHRDPPQLEVRPVFRAPASGDISLDPGSLEALAAPPTGLATADLDGDGRPDVLVALEGTPVAQVLFSNPDGSFTSVTLPDVGGSGTAVAVGDVDADGIPDVAVAEAAASRVSVFRQVKTGGHGGRTFQAPVVLDVQAQPVALVLADLDGDHFLDVACATPTGVVVLPGQGSAGRGNGTFAAPVVLDATAHTGLAVADLNGDHLPELLAPEAAGVRLFLGRRAALPQAAATAVPVTGATGALAVRDLNTDHIPDVVVGTATGVSFLLGQGQAGAPAGSFVGADHALAAAGDALALEDLDGDGTPDLLLAPRAAAELVRAPLTGQPPLDLPCSRFAAGLEGWTRSGPGTHTFQASNGFPDGFLEARLQDFGATHLWMDSPAAFRGSWAALQGGMLHVDLDSTAYAADYFDEPRVALRGAGMELGHSLAFPAGGWTAYNLPLVASLGWMKDGQPATEADLEAVLREFTTLAIQTNFDNDGWSTTRVDNVCFFEP